jgi:DNA (cytosine-5)-methyltransferase 1
MEKQATDKKMTMIDLFAGAGGLSCGLEQAGFIPILANEMIARFSETYRINHPNTQVITGDIRKIDAEYMLDIASEYGDIDLIAGGPPCQGFSINAPIRSLDDPRNHLFEEFLRIVRKIHPKAVLIENVPGIISLGKGTVIEQIYKSLEQMGYKVDHKILFAGHYGVPQMRFRTIIIAIRNYLGHIVFPSPKCYATATANFQKSKELCFSLNPLDEYVLKPKTTVKDALGDLPAISGGERYCEYDYPCKPLCDYQYLIRKDSSKITSHFCARLSEINKERLKYIPIGGSWRDIPYDLLPAGLKRARRSDHTKRYGRLDPEELCSTIMTKCDPHWGSFFHPEQPRAISVREAARIQSFPDKYIFTGSMTEQYEQVGNAVPPLLAKAVGESILKMLGD